MTKKIVILLVVTLVSIFILFLFPAIPQWPSYHHFADDRMVWGIPNFWNIVSNLPFFFIGVLGFFAIQRQWRAGNFVNWQEIAPFFIIFLGLTVTALGSAYYHFEPDNRSLVLDRIPMTLVFMGLLSLTIMERINFQFGFWLLFPLIIFGVCSVLYWSWTESLGRGDLRAYGFIQFYSIILILMILYLFPGSYPSLKTFLFPIFFYALAILFEYADIQINRWGGVISGHTLKHLSAAIGTYWFVVMVNEKSKNKCEKVSKFTSL